MANDYMVNESNQSSFFSKRRTSGQKADSENMMISSQPMLLPSQQTPLAVRQLLDKDKITDSKLQEQI